MSRFSAERQSEPDLDTTGTLIIKFVAEWCGPCKALASALEGQDVGVRIEEVDVEQNQQLAQQFGVRGVPSLVLLNEGKEVDRIVGATSVDKIINMVENNI